MEKTITGLGPKRNCCILLYKSITLNLHSLAAVRSKAVALLLLIPCLLLFPLFCGSFLFGPWFV